MKILIFGVSHVAAFKQGFDHLAGSQSLSSSQQQILTFFHKNIVDFITIPGPNWNNVVIQESPIVQIPRRTYCHVNGKPTKQINYSYDFDSFSISVYDCIIWCQGKNIISSYRELFGNVEYPPLLTSSLLDIFFHKVFLGSQFYTLVCSDSSPIFLYCGAPNSFLQSSHEPAKDCDELSNIHSRNISFIRKNYPVDMGFSLLMPPAKCVDPAGRFTYDKYARSPGHDAAHANALYGVEMLGQLKNFLTSYACFVNDVD